MDDQTRDYAMGYGKPPVETRFQKGQSGNPEGRPRGRRSLVALLGDALSHRSGMRNPVGSYKTQAEAIFAGLVGVAAGPDLKAKKLLFDVLIRLQQANICWPQERLPEVQFDESQAVTQDEVSAEIDRVAAIMNRDTAAPASLPGERPYDAQSADRAPEVAATPHPPR
jgi:hypothetical protein